MLAYFYVFFSLCFIVLPGCCGADGLFCLRLMMVLLIVIRGGARFQVFGGWGGKAESDDVKEGEFSVWGVI